MHRRLCFFKNIRIACLQIFALPARAEDFDQRPGMVELLEAAGYTVLQAADDLEPPEPDAPGHAENA